MRSHLLPILALSALLGACATTMTEGEVTRQRQSNLPVTRPTVVVSPLDELLVCVGSKLTALRNQPLVLGYALEDSSGKTDVSLPMLANSALHRIAGGGNNIQISSMALGTKQNDVQLAQITQLVGLKRMDPKTLVLPDWVISGGVSSVANGVLVKQDSFGVSAGSGDGGMSKTGTLDMVNLKFSLRHFESQSEFPGASISLSVSHQQLSSSVDGGMYVAARVDGKRYGAGVRMGRSVASANVLEDAIRVGVDYGVAFLIAERFNLDLSTCPIPAAGDRASLKPDETATSLVQIPAQLDRMKPEERLKWARAELTYHGYSTGESAADLARAVARYQTKAGIPPSGELDPSTMYRLSQAKLSRNESFLQPPPSGSGRSIQPIKIMTNSPVQDHPSMSLLRAQVVVPMAGHLYCLLDSPTGFLTMFPWSPSRGSYVNGRSPVLLPDNNAGAADPAAVLDVAGAHTLWCVLASQDVTKDIASGLQPGGNGKGFKNLAAAQEHVLATTGDKLLAMGQTSFNVSPKRARPPKSASPGQPNQQPKGDGANSAGQRPQG